MSKPDKKPDSEPRYVVVVKTPKKGWVPIQRDKDAHGKWSDPPHYSLAWDKDLKDDTPGIKPHKDGARARVEWAKKHGHEAKILKVADYEKSGAGGGDVRLSSGATWPKDPKLMALLHAVAQELGKPIQVVSGFRPVGSPSDKAGAPTQWGMWYRFKQGGNLAAVPGTSQHGRAEPGQGAADTDVVTSDGRLISIGSFPGGYAAVRKHGGHFSASGEPWHISCSGPDRWSP